MVDLNFPRPADTPKTLHNIVVLRIAQMLLESAIPPYLKKNTSLMNMFGYLQPSSRSSSPDDSRHDARCQEPGENVIDNIILAEPGESCDHLLEAKKLLLVRTCSSFYHL